MDLSLLPAMVADIHCGLRYLVNGFEQVGSEPSTELICVKVELPYAYLMAWIVLHHPDLMSAPSIVDAPVPFVQLLERSRWLGKIFSDVQRELRVRKSWEFFKCFPRFSGRYGDVLIDEEKPRTNRTALDVGCFRWLVNIRVGYLVLRVKNRCHIEPYLPSRFARQFGYDQLYVGNPSRGLKIEGGLIDGVRAWLWTMVGCTGAQFALPSSRRKPLITFLSCKWFLSANESIGVRSLSELQSEHLVQVTMMAARKAELAKKQGKKPAKHSLSSRDRMDDDEELLPIDDEDETSEEEYVDIDTDQEELDAGRTVDEHESLAARYVRSRPSGKAPTRVETRGKFVHERPVGSMRAGAPKKKKTAHKPCVGRYPYGVDLGDIADGEEGYYDEGELPPDPVFPSSDNMDSFMQQICDTIRNDSMDVDTEQVNSVEPTIPCSDYLKNPSMDIGEKESSVPGADVVVEKPVEDQTFHDVGFEEQGCASAPSFSGPDIGLFVDMLAEQASRGAVGPPFESDSFTVPVTRTDSIMMPGISSLPRSDRPTGPVTGTDTLMTPGIPRVPEDGGLAGVDIPSMTTPAVISEPVGSQPEGTSVDVGSRSSLYEHVRALLADTDPDRDIFRTDLGFFYCLF
ncbi:uncharacterized protein LOC109820755 [Asparagus officinalis]|uniref:uncharacterized protein LOC109820755 n=1 Tax=Asparagus officinalis TaxID=4686 RepID=UPI00098E1385|nr:uncharacterized protein LOC109820755 [Asparagus officinalis]